LEPNRNKEINATSSETNSVPRIEPLPVAQKAAPHNEYSLESSVGR